MKKLLVILAVMLSGCTYQSVNYSDIEAAAAACGGVEKIAELSSAFNGSESVICNNRTKHSLETRYVR